MDLTASTVALENGLDIRQVVTSGSVLQINEVYDEAACYIEPENSDKKQYDLIGQPVPNFDELEKTMAAVDKKGYVKKKIIEEGGGLPLDEVYTVSVAFSGYWENDSEPFDARKLHKPLVVDLKENGLLPGLQLAIKSMLVGETSLFLFSHKVMYGELGVPPRIKPKSSCAFYIKLIKAILSSHNGQIDLSEPNMFTRVYHEVVRLYSSGYTLYKTNNYSAAVRLFRKAIFMLHGCRLANENEEKIQEKMLKKIYLNVAICYNRMKQPQKACIACNELNRLNCLWNNNKALFQNAKALRMIGEFDVAEKRLKRAINIYSRKHKRNTDTREMELMMAELDLLQKASDSCNQAKLMRKMTKSRMEVSDDFKNEVDNLIKKFKENVNLCKLVMPSGLNSSEVAYIKETCIAENLFFNKITKISALEDDLNVTNVKHLLEPEENYALDKYEDRDSDLSLESNESDMEETEEEEEVITEV